MPRISEAESRVMHVLWERAPLTADEVVQSLGADSDWHEKTVKTLLNRLLRKGAISAVRDGRRYLYSPELSRERWQAQESRSLLDRAFGGRITPMLAHFSRHEKLTDKDLAQLRQLVEDIDRRQSAPTDDHDG